eukprot:1188155-Alexandrium_andersonii.AAC.1
MTSRGCAETEKAHATHKHHEHMCFCMWLAHAPRELPGFEDSSRTAHLTGQCTQQFPLLAAL